MANYSLSRLERLYLNKQPTFGVVPGVGNACRFIRLGLNNETATLLRPDKTGSRSQTVGILGRSFAKWSLEMSMHASGTAGVIPDCDPLLVGLFGQDAVIVGGTSVTYSLNEAITMLSIASYRTPSTLDQRIAHTCVVQEATFNLGQDVATWTSSGEGLWVIGSNSFSGLDATQKGGLGAFPVEPTPTTNGGIIAGFTGVATLAGNVIATIRTAQIRFQTQNMMVKDTFGSYYPTLTEGGERTVTTSFSVYDDDTAAIQTLKAASDAKTPIDIDYQIGTVIGNRWTFHLKNVQLAPFNLNDQQLRFAMDVGESRAYATSLTSGDECTLVIT
jgi:hypothetical protein